MHRNSVCNATLDIWTLSEFSSIRNTKVCKEQKKNPKWKSTRQKNAECVLWICISTELNVETVRTLNTGFMYASEVAVETDMGNLPSSHTLPRERERARQKGKKMICWIPLYVTIMWETGNFSFAWSNKRIPRATKFSRSHLHFISIKGFFSSSIFFFFGKLNITICCTFSPTTITNVQLGIKALFRNPFLLFFFFSLSLNWASLFFSY